MISGQREWELLEKIGFTRIGGSEEEFKAATILKEEVEAMGLPCEVMPFEVNGWDVKKVSLKTPTKEYEAAAVGYCQNTPEEGITAGFYYMEQSEGEVEKNNVKGKIVLTNGYMRYETYKLLCEAGAVGFINFGGDLRDAYQDTDLFTTRELRALMLKHGTLPGVFIRVHDAFELAKENPEEVTLTVIQDTYKKNSHDVITEIKGTQYPDEVIVFTAHYDSVEFSKGVYDNGSGSVINMELLRYFKENPPKRTVRFIWCGSEERGLLGSWAYVNSKEKELENVRFVINVDVAGPVLGQELIFVMAKEEVVSMVKCLAKEVGFSASIRQNIYSSDAIPFADKGIPGINFCRFGVGGTAYIHNRHDTLKFMSAESLEKTTHFVLEFAKRAINGAAFVTEREVPENIKKKVDEYNKK